MASEPIAGPRRWVTPTSVMLVGGALLPLGIVVIALGWYGVAHTPFAFEQNSYLISGGMLGLGLVFVGGFLYFGGWVARLVESTRAESERLIAALDRLSVGESAGATTAAAPATASAKLVATKTGTMYHRPDCTVMNGRADVRTVTADTPNMRPCRLCDPLGIGS